MLPRLPAIRPSGRAPEIDDEEDLNDPLVRVLVLVLRPSRTTGLPHEARPAQGLRAGRGPELVGIPVIASSAPHDPVVLDASFITIRPSRCR